MTHFMRLRRVWQRSINKSLFYCIVMVLTGCATPGKNTLPQGGNKSIADIYHASTATTEMPEGAEDSPLSLSTSRAMVSLSRHVLREEDYTQTAMNEIHPLFQRRENPAIPLYVYPHLTAVDTDDESPVPGYTTAFFLYRHHSFVLPMDRE